MNTKAKDLIIHSKLLGSIKCSSHWQILVLEEETSIWWNAVLRGDNEPDNYWQRF